jgi:hypothetical protein
MISIGYIQKTIKADLHVRSNNVILPRNLCGKVLEDSRRLSTKADPEEVTCGAGRPYLQADRPIGPSVTLPISMVVPHRLLGCIYAVP